MTSNQQPKNKNALPRRIVYYLLDNYGEQLGLVPENFCSYCEDKGFLSTVGAQNILDGRTFSLKTKSRKALFQIFRPAVPRLKEHWFQAKTFEKFENYFQLPEMENNKDHIATLELSLSASNESNYSSVAQEVLDHLVDRYFATYRYAYEDSGRIAKELLHIYKNKSNIRFRYYFRVKGDSRDKVRPCEGSVIFTGTNILLLGVYVKSHSGEARLRTVLLKAEGYDEQLHDDHFDHRIGIMLSGLPSINSHRNEPAAAKVLLERLEQSGTLSIKEINQYVDWIETDDNSFHDKAEIIRKQIKNVTKSHILFTHSDFVNDELSK